MQKPSKIDTHSKTEVTGLNKSHPLKLLALGAESNTEAMP